MYDYEREARDENSKAMPLSFEFSFSPPKAENPCLISHDSSTEGCPNLFLYSFVWGHFGDLSFHFHPSTITVFKLILLKQKIRKERRTWDKTKKWDGDPLMLGVFFFFFFFHAGYQIIRRQGLQIH